MSKKEGDQMQFSIEKRLGKKNEFTQPIIPVDGFVIKWVIRFINSIRNFFICFKMCIMQQRKNSRDEITKMGRKN